VGIETISHIEAFHGTKQKLANHEQEIIGLSISNVKLNRFIELSQASRVSFAARQQRA
jgi:hypothetical protein